MCDCQPGARRGSYEGWTGKVLALHRAQGRAALARFREQHGQQYRVLVPETKMADYPQYLSTLLDTKVMWVLQRGAKLPCGSRNGHGLCSEGAKSWASMELELQGWPLGGARGLVSLILFAQKPMQGSPQRSVICKAVLSAL